MKPIDSNSPLLSGAVDDLLLLAQTPTLPPVERIAEMRARLLAQVRSDSEPAVMTDLLTIRAQEGEWVGVAPNVELKILREFGNNRTCLVRLHPGGGVPAHQHMMEEECMVLEGEVQIGDLVIQAGDYHVAPSGVPHGLLYSRSGALLFLRGVTMGYAHSS